MFCLIHGVVTLLVSVPTAASDDLQGNNGYDVYGKVRLCFLTKYYLSRSEIVLQIKQLN